MTVPTNTQAQVVLPVWTDRGEIAGVSVTVNGRHKKFSHRTRDAVLPTGAIAWEGHESLVLAEMLPPGRHEIIVTHAEASMEVASRALPCSEPPKYRGKVQSIDRATGGDWQHRYGKDGYVLFSPRGQSDIAALPVYVLNVSTYDPDKLQRESGSYAPTAAEHQRDPAAASAALQRLNTSKAALALPLIAYVQATSTAS